MKKIIACFFLVYMTNTLYSQSGTRQSLRSIVEKIIAETPLQQAPGFIVVETKDKKQEVYAKSSVADAGEPAAISGAGLDTEISPENTGQIIVVTAEGTVVKKMSAEISAQEIKTMTVFPNPAQKTIRVQTADPEEVITQVGIYDESGRSVFKSVLNNRLINISSLKPGLYMIHVSTEKKMYTSKFMKQ